MKKQMKDFKIQVEKEKVEEAKRHKIALDKQTKLLK